MNIDIDYDECDNINMDVDYDECDNINMDVEYDDDKDLTTNNMNIIIFVLIYKNK